MFAFKDLCWSDEWGRFDLYFYLFAYRDANENLNVRKAVCERSEWERLKKTTRKNSPIDRKLLFHSWKTFSSIDPDQKYILCYNHQRFVETRICRPLNKNFDFKPWISSKTIEIEKISPIKAHRILKESV